MKTCQFCDHHAAATKHRHPELGLVHLCPTCLERMPTPPKDWSNEAWKRQGERIPLWQRRERGKKNHYREDENGERIRTDRIRWRG